MKRLITSIVIMTVMIIGSTLILAHLYQAKTEIISMIDDIIVTTENKDYEDAYIKSKYFNEYWDKEEKHLIKYVRHSQLDAVTSSVARLPFLIKYQEYGEFLGELDQIKATIEHIWGAELPTFNNIL